MDQLHGKRGKQYYHLPWSVYADLSSISDAQLMLFIRAVKQHVLDSLTQIYSEGMLACYQSNRSLMRIPQRRCG